jgi:hypothetical protein
LLELISLGPERIHSAAPEPIRHTLQRGRFLSMT